MNTSMVSSERTAEITLFNSQRFSQIARDIHELAKFLIVSVVCRGREETTQNVRMDRHTFYVRWDERQPKGVAAFWIKHQESGITFFWPSPEAFGSEHSETQRGIKTLHIPVDEI